MALYTPTNVLVGAGTMYVGPANTPPPADSVPLGGTWPAAWVNPGATEQGLSFSVNSQTQDIMVEEQSTPVLVVITTKQVQVAVTLSEDTVANMKLAYGGGTLTTTAAGAAGSGIAPKTTLTLNDNLDSLAVAFEGRNVAGLARRVYIPVVISAAQVQTSYRRAANNRSYPVTLRAICPPTAITISDITGAAA